MIILLLLINSQNMTLHWANKYVQYIVYVYEIIYIYVYVYIIKCPKFMFKTKK